MVREERTVEVTILSAIGLKNVAKHGKEPKYSAVAFIYPARKKVVTADPHGGVNPIWNARMKLSSYETDIYPAAKGGEHPVSPTSSMITVEIYSQTAEFFHHSDKLVGTIRIPLHDVASASSEGDGGMAPMMVHLPQGGVQGTLSLSVKLGSKRELRDDEDIVGTPAHSHNNNEEFTVASCFEGPTIFKLV